MSKEDLPIYLNDHLAGSVGALELLDHLIKTYKENPLEQFFKDLRSEIDADQDTLQDLIEKLGMKESADWSSIFESSRKNKQISSGVFSCHEEAILAIPCYERNYRDVVTGQG
jgi:hypothetical protein